MGRPTSRQTRPVSGPPPGRLMGSAKLTSPRPRLRRSPPRCHRSPHSPPPFPARSPPVLHPFPPSPAPFRAPSPVQCPALVFRLHRSVVPLVYAARTLALLALVLNCNVFCPAKWGGMGY